ncbi:hypothetical protein C7S15_1227 [Burkholderia cepacia]|nr:hypothetical protein [Burkholderia cepacia]
MRDWSSLRSRVDMLEWDYTFMINRLEIVRPPVLTFSRTVRS